MSELFSIMKILSFIFLEEPYGQVPEFGPNFETFFQKSIPCLPNSQDNLWEYFLYIFLYFQKQPPKAFYNKRRS